MKRTRPRKLPDGFIEPETVHCLRCKQDKPPSDFSRWGTHDKNGYRAGYQTWCKQCVTDYSGDQLRIDRKNELRAKKRADPVYRKAECERQKAHCDKNPIHAIYSAAKGRARELGLPFNITKEDLPIADLCPVLGVPMVRRTRFAPSIDKINPKLGYVKGNVQIISKLANFMKNDATEEELLAFATYYYHKLTRL